MPIGQSSQLSNKHHLIRDDPSDSYDCYLSAAYQQLHEMPSDYTDKSDIPFRGYEIFEYTSKLNMRT